MKSILLATFALWLLFPSTSAFGATCGMTPPTGSVSWTTQWCDEFNGATIDTNTWTFDTGNSGFGNNELENYCDPSSNAMPCNSGTPNAYITPCTGGSCLAIQVLSPSANTWTSARLKTQIHGSNLGQTFNSGRIEAKLQIPSHPGLWPAFWMLGSQANVSWPTVGESDIMENWPTTSNIAGPGATGNCSTIHTQVTAGNGKGKCFTFPSGQQGDTAFHIYGQIWSANMIQYYIDDPTQPFFVVTASDLPAGDIWPFSSPANPFFIIMNIAVGGTLGAPTDSTTGSQAPMLVDYVRQYIPSAVSPPQLTPNGNITISAGATSGNTTTVDMVGTIGTGRVTFTCTTNAPQTSCVVTSNDSLNNHTVDFTNSATASPTVTVTTTYFAAAAGITGRNWFGIAAGILLALVVGGVMRNGDWIRVGVGVASIVLAIAMLPACGGGYGSTTNGPPSRTGTPTGSYKVTVNAFTVSSTDASGPNASTSFNLTVN